MPRALDTVVGQGQNDHSKQGHEGGGPEATLKAGRELPGALAEGSATALTPPSLLRARDRLRGAFLCHNEQPTFVAEQLSQSLYRSGSN